MRIQIADRLQQTEEYYFSKKLREVDELNSQGKEIINLGIGSPDFMPPSSVINTLIDEVKRTTSHGYQSYKGILPYRQAIADWYKKKYGVILDANSNILPLLGSKEGVMHICMTYLQEGDECLVPNPGYPTYQSAVRISGAQAIPYTLSEENNWFPDLKLLARQNLENVKLMWINYPHMPTGAKATKEFFESIIEFGKKHNILICHDNPYSFILNNEPLSILSIPGAMEVALELNSLSKTFNMAGWRMGMLLASEERIAEVMRFKSNMDSGMFMPIQKAAISALSVDQEWYSEQNKVYVNRRKKVFELLDSLECTYDKNQVGLFVWASISSKYKDGYNLCDDVLYKANVFITPGGIFGDAGKKYVRVSLCNKAEIIELATQRIKESI